MDDNIRYKLSVLDNTVTHGFVNLVGYNYQLRRILRCYRKKDLVVTRSSITILLINFTKRRNLNWKNGSSHYMTNLKANKIKASNLRLRIQPLTDNFIFYRGAIKKYK